MFRCQNFSLFLSASPREAEYSLAETRAQSSLIFRLPESFVRDCQEHVRDCQEHGINSERSENLTASPCHLYLLLILPPLSSAGKSDLAPQFRVQAGPVERDRQQIGNLLLREMLLT
ncbi:MAG: hypothetical protein B6245_00205 [Desulfobacteraceae bacterium 4572_88]|nr:MAG: hypothetical protein B6245_00205 [Desulfobacteraceae bacterium 4572_88]RLC13151.1 MAG: hypothetical protein DRI57_16790 [Deltaproteobacteria bacterium]